MLESCQTPVMPSAFVFKKCTCCNLEFPKTEDYFFVKVIKQQNKSGLAIYNSFRSICKSCFNKKTEANRIKKKCKEMNCDVSEYQNKWKEKYIETRTFDKEAKNKLTKSQYKHYLKLLKEGVVFNVDDFLKYVYKSKIERNIRLSKIQQSKRKYFGKEEKRLALRKYAKNEKDRLTDAYVANFLLKKTVKELPKEIIETKRLIIKIKRQLNYGS